MYKIFIDDKPFILANSDFRDISLPTFDFDRQMLEEKINEVFSQKFEGVVFKCNDIDSAFELFSAYFQVIEAAGGLVFNTRNELLLIERLGVWDLPKGKIDKGETPEIAAIREVEEECGINGLTIEKSLASSYHVYYFKNKYVLKRTYWYKMNSTFKGQLVPQMEENITKVEWRDFKETDIDTLNTYQSIKEILKGFWAI